MSDRTVQQLRTALTDRAENAMSTTDTQRELARLQEGMRPVARQRRRRMIAVAVVGVAAAGIIGGAIFLALPSSSGNGSHSGVAHQPTVANKLPAGLPHATFQRSGAIIAAQLILNADGTATLSDGQGSNREALSLAAPGTLRFDPPADHEYCTAAGTYRFTLAVGRLSFTKVADTCSARVQFLTMAPWQQLGGPVAAVPTDFPTGRLEVANSPTQVAMTVSSDGGVTLTDNRGNSRETLTFLAAGRVTFSKDDFFCQVAGTYHYSATATTVRFALVHDTCRDRRIFLTTAAFTKTG